jgi:cytochrome c biogenesis factor
MFPPAAGYLVVALYVYRYRCDESCTGVGWSHLRGSWEWSLQFWCLAIPGVLAAFLVVYLLARRRPWSAAVALTMCVGLFALWYLLPAH